MKELLDKFFAGATTADEERKIYDAFATGREVPEELEPYRSMFMMYAEAAGRRPRKRRMSWLTPRGLWQVAGAAAAAAVLIVGGFTFAERRSSLDMLEARYAGSYIVVDGVKQTDIPSIMPQLREAESRIERQQREVDRMIAEDMKRLMAE